MKSSGTLFLAGLCLLALTGPGRATLLDTNLPSQFYGWNRGIHIYLPPSYESKPHRRYPVLYLQDGENVFSAAGTNAAFGWGSWQLDQTAEELARAGNMREIIMVAVDNSRERLEEYNGQHNSAGHTATNTTFENYEAFLTTELKPWIDRHYRTLPDAANTAVMGSSLGGLCSLALAWDHPEVFGGAASLSGAYQVDHSNFLNQALGDYHGPPKPFRIYLDSGVTDFTGGDDNHSFTEKVAAEFRRIGWTDKNLEVFTDTKPLTPFELQKTGLRQDKWAEAQTSQHNEFYWRLRAWRALMFLFPPPELK